MTGRIALGLALALLACEPTERTGATDDTAGTGDGGRASRRSATILVGTLDPAAEETGVTQHLLDTAVAGGFFVGDTLYMNAFALRDALAPSATIVQRGGALYVNDTLFGAPRAMLSGVPLVNAKQFARRFGAYIATTPQYGYADATVFDATIWPREVLLFLSRNREHQDQVAVLVGARAEGLLPPLVAPARD